MFKFVRRNLEVLLSRESFEHRGEFMTKEVRSIETLKKKKKNSTEINMLKINMFHVLWGRVEPHLGRQNIDFSSRSPLFWSPEKVSRQPASDFWPTSKKYNMLINIRRFSDFGLLRRFAPGFLIIQIMKIGYNKVSTQKLHTIWSRKVRPEPMCSHIYV